MLVQLPDSLGIVSDLFSETGSYVTVRWLDWQPQILKRRDSMKCSLLAAPMDKLSPERLRDIFKSTQFFPDSSPTVGTRASRMAPAALVVIPK
jgi:hypothetical protein